MEYIIEKMKTEDWEGVRKIYLEGIKTGNSTFQAQAPDWKEWDTGHSSECRLVAKKRDEVLGWAALSLVSSRCVYSGVAEVSIYVGEKYRKNNIGTNLLKKIS
jgi:phosphinothricin acetyltransferase